MNARHLIEAEDPKSVLHAARHAQVTRNLKPGWVHLYPSWQVKREEAEALVTRNLAKRVSEFEYHTTCRDDDLIDHELYRLRHPRFGEAEDPKSIFRRLPRKITAWQFWVKGTFHGQEKMFLATFRAASNREARSKLWDLVRDKGVVNGEIVRFSRTPLNEAEDPKAFLRRLSAGRIWPGENYWLNVADEDEDWRDAEFCPVRIKPGNKMEQLDGLYGLDQNVAVAVGYEGEGGTLEPKYHAAMDAYLDPIYTNVEHGITSGVVDGVAGRRKWRIVYHPDVRLAGFGGPRWDVNAIEPVVPNKQYGEGLPKQEAVKVARRVLEAEDPKSVFKRLPRKPDFMARSEGNLVLIRPMHDDAAKWLHDTAPEDAQFWVGSLVVEPRYLRDVITAMEEDGWTTNVYRIH